MSSFVGHSLTAVGIYYLTKPPQQKSTFNFLWLAWLIVVASTPDIDYLVKFLHRSNHEGLRITHSFFFSLILPSITIIVLILRGIKGSYLNRYSWQIILVALSHLVLDLLVGVTPLPLLFFVSDYQFKLPWGILPSAGRPDIYNHYFCRNLYIEVGVLLPLLWALVLMKHVKRLKYRGILISTFLISISIYFMNYSYHLPR